MEEIGRSRVLGVDLGARRIGLALSDRDRVIAMPHSMMRRGKDHPSDHRAIVGAAERAGAGTIVVGLPLSLSGRKGPAARSALTEIDELRLVAGPQFEVVVHDERLTTVTAERALQAARVSKEAQRDVVDKVAAAVMLQSWLDAGGSAPR